MNSFLLFENEYKAPNYKVCEPERVNHVLNILKSKEGDLLKVTVVGKGIGQALLAKISPKEIELKIKEISPKYFGPFELLIGLSRPPTCKKILEHGTSMGVSKFNFYPAELSEKSYQESKLFSDFEKYLKYGLSQSGIYHQMPKVNLKKEFSGEQKFILSPKTKKTFKDFKIDPKKMITLAIGPERGFLNKEIDSFKEQGFLEVSLGPAILRVEIATFAALGQLHLLFGT